MRLGFNPHKDKPVEESYHAHQVIIPVYIPNFEGYFKDAFVIFKKCLDSLFFTSHNRTFFTIINNGSCKEIVDYLNQLQLEKKIHEVIHTENIGKLNAIVKGIAGNNIDLVTISDSDVLFLKNWQSETVKVFNNFPKAGVVGIVPQFRSFTHFCGNILFDNLFSKTMRFTKVSNPLALQKFYESVGWNNDYNKAYLEWNLTISNNNFSAIVGSGHFVTTYKRELFEKIVTYHKFKMGADSEFYLDELPLEKGAWRLTTNENFAYHMGNVEEDWMEKKMNTLKNIQPEFLEFNGNSELHTISRFHYFIKNKLFIKLFKKRKLRLLFYRYKGLPHNEISRY